MLPNLPHISLLGKRRFRLRIRHVAIIAVAWAFFSLVSFLTSDDELPVQDQEIASITPSQPSPELALINNNDVTVTTETLSVRLDEDTALDQEYETATSLASVPEFKIADPEPKQPETKTAVLEIMSPAAREEIIASAKKTAIVSPSNIERPTPKPGQRAKIVATSQDASINPIQRIAEKLSRVEPAAGIPRKVGNTLLPQRRPESLVQKASFNPEKFVKAHNNKRRSTKRQVTVSTGDTLAKLLTKKIGIPVQDAYDTVEYLNTTYSPQSLRPGHKLTGFFKKSRITGNLEYTGLQIDTDIVNSIVVKKFGVGDYAVAKSEKKLKRTLKAAQGTIDSSLYVEASRQGVPDPVILSMIRVYSWAIDFQRDLREGDQFEIMYEEFRTEDGQLVKGRGDMLYANLTLSSHHNPIYRYARSADDIDYYEPDGSSVRKTLMKTPVDGARISSGFGRRKHPVLGYTKMHKGVDFAAPRGTPIYAAGDGTIEKLGRNGSFGHYIRIRHHNGLKTAYAHLKGYKSGLRSGSRVKQGQIIGYVGTTGRSTGPHLHYEVHLNGRQVNPRTVKLPQGHSLKGTDLATFKGFVSQTKVQFADLGFTTTIAQN